MLGLRNLISAAQKVVLPGGTKDDGDWAKMTDVNWNAVGPTSDTVWSDWDVTADN